MQTTDKIQQEIRDIEAKDTYWHSPLYLAVTKNNLAAVDSLLKQGSKPLLDDTFLLHIATLNNNLAIVNKLLSVSDINAQDKEGNTALHLAAQHGYKEIVLSLLEAGAYHKLINHNGKTPIKAALKAGKTDIAQIINVTIASIKKERLNAIDAKYNEKTTMLEQENKVKTAQIAELTSQLKNIEALLNKKTTEESKIHDAPKIEAEKERQKLASKIDQLVPMIKPESLIEVLDLALKDEHKALDRINEDLHLSSLFVGCEATYQAQQALKIFYPTYKSYLHKKLLHRPSNACIVTLQGHTSHVYSLQVLPNNKLASGSTDNTVKIWDIATKQCEATLEGHTHYVSSLQVLPNNKLASGSGDATIKIWDITTEQCEATLKGHIRLIWSIQVLLNNKLVSGSGDATIKIWDIATKQCEATLRGHTNHVRCLQVLPNNKLVSGSYDNTIKIWDITTKQCEATLKGHTSYVMSLQVLPNNKLASGSDDKTIKIWNITTKQCEATLEGHTNYVHSLQVLPNNKLASGSSDNTIKIWDIATKQCEATLEGHTSQVLSLQVLPNNKLASGSHDNTIKIWDIEWLLLKEQQTLEDLDEKVATCKIM